MLWDTARMTEHYRLALSRVLAGLFVMAGLEPGKDVVAVLPRRVRSAILLVLRPAESAVRRLVVAKTKGLEVPTYVPPTPRSQSKDSAKKTGQTRIPRFQLIDPRKVFAELNPNRRLRRSRPARTEAIEPRLLFRVAGFDGQPAYEEWSEAIPAPSPDDPIVAAHICRRMQALHHALNDLPKQAQRMVREIAKRAAAKPGPRKVPPLRFGSPPGFRKKHIHEIDSILHECHCLAIREQKPPDRS